MASRIQGITVEIGGDTTKLSKALESVNKSIKGTQSGLKDVNKLLKLDPSNTELVVQKQKMLKDAIEATKEKLATLKTAAQQANEQLANGEITQQQYDALQREIVETEQNLRSLQDQAATTNATLAKIDEAGEKLQNIGSSVENVGKKFLPVTAAVTGLGTAAVKTAADFDSEMSKVSAISGATGDDFDQLRAKAREMGAKTKFSASEAASAMEYMAMAGWKTSDMLNGIEGVMNLAAASGEDLATTSDIVTDALTAFGLSAEDSGHFADILAAASSNANTNVSMMGETFKYCAPIAGALGFSAEDTAEAIGLMANSGIKASQAGTSLRTIMNNLSGEVTFVGKNIGEVTIATSNADGSMRSLNDILADCRVAFSGLSESEKAANAEALVGKNAMSGFLALMNSSETDINKLRGAIENCDGASESMAETMQDNLNGQLTILKSQLEELAISFGDILMPIIRKIVSAVQQFVDKLNSMDESTRETIVKIGLLAASIGPLLIVLGKTISTVGTAMRGFSSLAKGVRLLITHVGSASGVFSKLGVVLGGLSGPVVAVVAVVGTLVAAFMNLWNTNEEFRTAITGIWNDIVSKVKGFCDQLTQRINGLGFDFKDVTEVLKVVWDGFCQVLAPLFEGAFQIVATVLSTVLDTLLGLFDVFSNVFSGNWSGAWEAVKGIFSSIWDGVKSVFSTTLTALKSALDVFLGLFGTDWQTVWGSIKSFFETVWSGISSFFSNTVSTIQSVATTVFTAVSSFFTTVLTSIQTTFSPIWTAISTAVSSVLNTIHTTVTTVWMAISTAISTVMNSISITITTVWNGSSGQARLHEEHHRKSRKYDAEPWQCPRYRERRWSVVQHRRFLVEDRQCRWRSDRVEVWQSDLWADLQNGRSGRGNLRHHLEAGKPWLQRWGNPVESGWAAFRCSVEDRRLRRQSFRYRIIYRFFAGRYCRDSRHNAFRSARICGYDCIRSGRWRGYSPCRRSKLRRWVPRIRRHSTCRLGGSCRYRSGSRWRHRSWTYRSLEKLRWLPGRCHKYLEQGYVGILEWCECH